MYLHYAIDITERKQQEKEIKKLAEFPSKSPNPVLRTDGEGTLLYANEGSAPLLKDWGCRVGDRLPDDHARVVVEVLNSGTPTETEHLSGNRHYSLTFAPIVDAREVNLYGLDITERKRDQQQVERLSERLKLANRAAEVGVWDWDVQSNVIVWDDSMYTLYGIKREDFSGAYEAWFQSLHPKDSERLDAEIQSALRSETEYDTEFRIVRPDGVVRYIRAIADVIRDDRGEPARMIGVNWDITEPKRMEQELRESRNELEERVKERTAELAGANENLRSEIREHARTEETRRQLETQLRQSQKLEAVGQLAGGVAHDFNNILTGIGGYTNFVLERLEKETQDYQDLSEVRRLTDRAADLTRQLLAFSRRQTLVPVVLNINAVLENLAKMLKRLIGEHLNLAFHPAADLGNARADPGQIEQVMMNLALNARDAMPDGGQLTIETANVELDQSHADRYVGVTPGRYVMLAVSDNGCGMDEATLEQIFEPFFTTKELGKGTGLGLATVYGIVKQHGGNIWVHSEPGKGTTFKIYLPRVGEEAETLDRKRADPPPMLGGETILLVEDEESVREIARRGLKDYGYAIISAGSPEEAEKMFDEHGDRIDLLLTDVVLPGRNGRQLYEALKAKSPSLKVLYTSGYTDNAILHHGVFDANTSFIQKPFTPSSLARKVREILDETPSQ